ncbi:MAG: sensor histidine kinase [Pseudoclavibacter sp.]
MTESRAGGASAERPWIERMPWWSILFTVVPALSLVAVAVYSSGLPVELLPLSWTASALVIAIVVFWFTYARRHIGPSVRGYIGLAVISALLFAAILLIPVLGIMQAIYYPYLWCVFERTSRSIAATIVFALGLAGGAIAMWGADEALTTIFAQAFSIMMSIGIGLAITHPWTVADRQQALYDELLRAQEQIRELSRQSGISLERERLSRELHDTLAQTLAGLSLLSERAARGARRRHEEAAAAAASGSGSGAGAGTGGGAGSLPVGADDDVTLAQLDQIAELAKTALGETRALIVETAPVHDETGTTFEQAIERLAERFRRETGVEVDVDLDGSASSPPPASIPRDHQVVLLRSLQEGLSNVRRHANATRADVRLAITPARDPADDADAPPAAPCAGRGAAGSVSLSIADDGRGFDADSVPGSGFGLPGLRERARLLDGTVEIDSAPDRGSIVTITLPLPDARARRSNAGPAGAAAGATTEVTRDG